MSHRRFEKWCLWLGVNKWMQVESARMVLPRVDGNIALITKANAFHRFNLKGLFYAIKYSELFQMMILSLICLVVFNKLSEMVMIY